MSVFIIIYNTDWKIYRNERMDKIITRITFWDYFIFQTSCLDYIIYRRDTLYLAV